MRFDQMTLRRIVLVVSLLLVVVWSPRPASKRPAMKRPLISEIYAQLPLAFEANHGQTDASVKFLSRGAGYSLLLRPTAAVWVLSKRAAENSGPAILRMQFLGANPEPDAKGMDELPGKSNYLVGNVAANWRTGIPNYSKVR